MLSSLRFHSVAAGRAAVRGVRWASTAGARKRRQLTRVSMNKNIVKAEYAVRGTIVLRAMALEAELKAGKELPFDKLIFCNIGNPQSLEQPPITFFREVMALLEHPALLTHPEVTTLFSKDAVKRATRLNANIPGGLGAYSESQGVKSVRQSVARFIAKRDGHSSSAKNIFLTDGASPAVQMLIRSMLRRKKDAIMIPIPQYPLYSASIALYGGTQVGYELDEATNWSLPIENLHSALKTAREEGKLNVRALAVINPGNPTGTCLEYENIKDIVEFARDERLLLLADEVYQTNLWDESRPFVSFKKVARDIGAIKDGLQLASFHSVSKGFLGECGKRGGYVELEGFNKSVKDQLYKLASISLCSNVAGQAMVDLMVNPPSDQHPTYARERDEVLASLKRRAEHLVTALNKLDGVSCQPAQGALYVFPQIHLPHGAVAAANAAQLAPDTFYCMRLLESTGIVVVPGSGFGQHDGTWHLRCTILPPEHDMERVVRQFGDFHNSFMAQYA